MNTIAMQLLMLASILLLSLSAALPTARRATSETATEDSTPQLQRRIARKVGNLNVTSTPQQYVRDLYEDYELENGRTRQTTERATDVWCFPDKDIAKETFREKPVRTTKCTTYTQYVFQWSSVMDQIESGLLDVESGKLRAYIQIINRHIAAGASVDVNLTVLMVPRLNATQLNITANSTDWSEAVFAGQQVLTVSHGSDGWVELNVTEGAREIWPLIPTHTEVQVIIKAEVNCAGQKKVPLNFVNPAEIPLEQENRRARHLDLQPFLVVFSNNRETQAVLNQEHIAVGEQDNGTFINLGDALYPEKRSANSDECSIERYVVDLHELGLTYILAPTALNISKCAGNCNNRNTINRLGTNHAKIMMAIYNAEVNAVPPVEEVSATPPCCVPTDYRVVYFLMTPLDGTAAGIKSHNHLVATRCGCR